MDFSKFEKIENYEVKRPEREKPDKSEIYYFDSEGKATDKSHAATAIVRELDKDGNLIRETHAVLNNNNYNKSK